jgi:uncharacterized protein (DUF433 family)
MSNKSENPKKSSHDFGYVSPKKDDIVSRQNHHVIRHNDGWAVRAEGNSRDIVRVATQQEAIERAREIAERKGTEVIVHDRDGKIAGREVLRVNDWELAPLDIALNKYIDNTLFGERPHVRERRILVSMIAANAAENQWSNLRLAEEFSLSEEEVLAALLYYREHKEEIDQQDAEEQKQFDNQYRLHGKS